MSGGEEVVSVVTLVAKAVEAITSKLGRRRDQR